MNLYRRNDLRTSFEDVGVLYFGVVGFFTVWVLDGLSW